MKCRTRVFTLLFVFVFDHSILPFYLFYTYIGVWQADLFTVFLSRLVQQNLRQAAAFCVPSLIYLVVVLFVISLLLLTLLQFALHLNEFIFYTYPQIVIYNLLLSVDLKHSQLYAIRNFVTTADSCLYVLKRHKFLYYILKFKTSMDNTFRSLPCSILSGQYVWCYARSCCITVRVYTRLYVDNRLSVYYTYCNDLSISTHCYNILLLIFEQRSSFRFANYRSK